MRDFEKLSSEGQRACNPHYEMSAREMTYLLKEVEKGSPETFKAFMKCFYAGFGAGQRCLRAEQKRLEKISKSSPKVPQIVE